MTKRRPDLRLVPSTSDREPETEYDRWQRETVEPTLPDRYQFPGRRKRLSPWREIPAVGLTLVVLLLLAMWIAGLLGLR